MNDTQLFLKFDRAVQKTLDAKKKKIADLAQFKLYQQKHLTELTYLLNRERMINRHLSTQVSREPSFSLKQFFSNALSKIKSAAHKVAHWFLQKATSIRTYFKPANLAPSVPQSNLTENRDQLKADASKTPRLSAEHEILRLIEQSLAIFIGKTVSEHFKEELLTCLKEHRVIKNNAFPQAVSACADLINQFIAFRDLELNYSDIKLLNFTAITAKNYDWFLKLIENIKNDKDLKLIEYLYRERLAKQLNQGKSFLKTLSDDTQVNLSQKNIVQKSENVLSQLAQKKGLNFAPIISYFSNKEINLVKPSETQLKNTYANLKHLFVFMDKIINHENYLLDLIYHIIELKNCFKGLSAELTELLIRDQFPFLREFSELIKNSDQMVALLKTKIEKIEKIGLNETLIRKAKDACDTFLTMSKNWTKVKIYQQRMLLFSEKLLDSIRSFDQDLVLKNKLLEIKASLLDKNREFVESDLQGIEIRLKKIRNELIERRQNQFHLLDFILCRKKPYAFDNKAWDDLVLERSPVSKEASRSNL